jgi:molybdopterin molybdotransferase
LPPDAGVAPPLALDDALARMRDIVRPVAGTETLGLEQALGRALAAPVAAPRALPPFDNTGVDGYAFRRADAPAAGPARLRLVGESAAGVPFSGEIPRGAAIRISTGAVLPESADTVVMQEDCRREADAVLIDPVPAAGANIRRAGADIAVGAEAVTAGRRLQPQDIALLRALGLVDVAVRRRLRIAVAATGAELREPGADLAPGQIVESNGLMLQQLLARLPVETVMLRTLPDDRTATEAALTDAAGSADLVITTGGVSVGDHDHVRPAVVRRGRVHFWRLAVRPGKPVLFGDIGTAYIVGLPGNPVSAMLMFLMVVRPLIDRLLGADARPLAGFAVPLAATLRKDGALREFQRARLEDHPAGLRVRPYGDQSSNLLSSLAWADGILDLPVGKALLDEGQRVTFRPFEGLLG